MLYQIETSAIPDDRPVLYQIESSVAKFLHLFLVLGNLGKNGVNGEVDSKGQLKLSGTVKAGLEISNSR